MKRKRGVPPYIIIHNLYGGGPQIIVDVAVTGVNGKARRSDLDADQPLYYRLNQKKAKYARAAQDHGLILKMGKFQLVLQWI